MAARAAPRVSVLLPTHNRADVVGFAIQSALAQTYTHFELLVAGDGCTDSTSAVVSSFSDPRLTWLPLPKAPGVGYANRNRALRAASGELIAYLAHDDLWLPDHLQRLVACLDSTRAELAYSQAFDVAADGRLTVPIFDLTDPPTRQAWLTHYLGYLPMCAVIHRRDCLEKYGWWREDLLSGGDWDLWSRILQRGGDRNVAYLRLPTAFHFVANWRRQTPTWRTRLRRALRGLEAADLPELKLDLRAGPSEQAIVWRALQAAPLAWPSAIRRAAEIDSRRHAAYAYLPTNLLDRAARAYHRRRNPPPSQGLLE